MYIETGFQWFFIGELLQWISMLTACFCGTRLVRTYEKRALLRPNRRALLRRRMRQLERQSRDVDARLQQLVEAERFAAALRLKPAASEMAWQAGPADRTSIDSRRSGGR
jgi:hypothetical protein